MTNPIEEAFGRRKYFINTLSLLTDIDIQILVDLYKGELGSGYPPKVNSGDDYEAEFNGSLEKLRAYGFVNSKMNGPIRPGVNWAEISFYTISDFGREFVSFCLENEKDKLK